MFMGYVIHMGVNSTFKHVKEKKEYPQKSAIKSQRQLISLIVYRQYYEKRKKIGIVEGLLSNYNR